MSSPQPPSSDGPTLARLSAAASAGDAPAFPKTGQYESWAKAPTISSDHSALVDAPPPAEDGPLPEIPGYVVVKKLGGGGMGEVYEVVNRLGRRFALKIIRPDRHEGESQVRFRKEAGALLELDHPNIARIFEYNEVDGKPYYTMRLMTGGTLASRYAEYCLWPQKSLPLMACIADAVGYVHRRNLLHRDLKPNNILFDEEGKPYVSDFGLVKDLKEPDGEEAAAGSSHALSDTDNDQHTLTMAGQALGTLRYMSPEQVRGDKEHIQPRSDVWALGVMLYEMMTGRRPFEGTDRGKLRAQILHVDPPTPRQLRPDIDPPLERIILRCLAKDPGQRYTTAAELARELHLYLQEEKLPGAMPVSRTPPQSWRGPLFVAVAALLAVGVAIALFFAKRKPDPRQELLDGLARGDAVQLIGQKGTPAYFKVARQPGGTKPVYEHPDGTFSVETHDLVLVELVPPGACPNGLRLRAKVRHNRGEAGLGRREPGMGRGGIYVGHVERSAPGHDNHLFADLTFTDDFDPFGEEGPRVKGEQLGAYLFALHQYQQIDKKQARYAPFEIEHEVFRFLPTAPGEESPWRTLEVEVRPQGIAAFWDGKQVAAFSRAQMGKAAAAIFRDEAGPLFPPEGGAGLHVFRASMSFCDVRVTPLP